jgi:hypothetical protein
MPRKPAGRRSKRANPTSAVEPLLIAGVDNPNIKVRVRKSCSQLFFVYTGHGGRPGMHGLRFLREGRLADRNLALLRDSRHDDYMSGVGNGIDDLDSLLAWHEACRRSLDHVSSVYCIGNSMGGYAAVLFACMLKAKTAWAFSLRPTTGMEAVENLRRLLDESDGGTTEYRLYYSLADEVDKRCAEILAPCHGVVLCPQEPQEGYESHAVMLALADSGRFGELFPPCAPSGR